METNNKAHISVRKLNIFYEKKQILFDINIDIPKNKITAIIGPSGCGKTTLLRSFNKLVENNAEVKLSGQIFVDDKDIFDPKTEITLLRKKMGLLFQRPYPLPMSIYDNVAYGPRIHGIKKKKELNQIVEYYLKEAGLWNEVADRLHDPASRLSLGQQQRLCLARGLAVKPEIVLCDEPTSALDPQSSQHIENKFKELKGKYTIVLVTHLLPQAMRLADYVIFLYMGKIIECNSAQHFFNEPKEKLTQDYLHGMIC